jgi:hypothetical protein
MTRRERFLEHLANYGPLAFYTGGRIVIGDLLDTCLPAVQVSEFAYELPGGPGVIYMRVDGWVTGRDRPHAKQSALEMRQHLRGAVNSFQAEALKLTRDDTVEESAGKWRVCADLEMRPFAASVTASAED